ncbi:hypothetical protein J0H58_26945 [bacterium]|nr:hypothetical protein [bacterium]
MFARPGSSANCSASPTGSGGGPRPTRPHARPGPAHRTPAPDPVAVVTCAEARAALDEELARLPDALRVPLLLCYYEGWTQDEAAAELGQTARRVKARGARGRVVLRARQIPNPAEA